MPNHDRFECQTAIDSDAILQTITYLSDTGCLEIQGASLAHKTPQRRHSAFTEYVRNNRLPETVIRVKQPALARFSPDIAPLFVHFRADDDVTARLYARGYRLRPEFFK
ncbi:nitrite extrusion protein 2 [Shigella sonnei]|nr:nitrite extrusion protein 2 [Shigella sonnei]SRI48215.1 nitrite extrusion protein 2 [Shigella sonnei]SRI60493.1 nitrite extrusion protein 2 [Shigella sonnei]SRI79722.1 nitrite extrusion protein 2 [Shigella sonnei]SRI91717.1 nitrite extrusion protein 2 [Shigella sonnei]